MRSPSCNRFIHGDASIEAASRPRALGTAAVALEIRLAQFLRLTASTRLSTFISIQLALCAMYPKPIELLHLLLDATRKRQVLWQQEGVAFHRAELADLHCSLRFKHLLLAGDDGSDADAVEVTAGGSVLTFYSGTEGFDLVGEILATAYPEIGEHHQQFTAGLDETIEKIRKLTA